MVGILAENLIGRFDTYYASRRVVSLEECSYTSLQVYRKVFKTQTLLVLLVLVVADHLTEQRRVLGPQLLRHVGQALCW